MTAYHEWKGFSTLVSSFHFVLTGYSNVGINPLNALIRIRNLLGYHHESKDQSDETLLGIMIMKIDKRSSKENVHILLMQHIDVYIQYEDFSVSFQTSMCLALG